MKTKWYCTVDPPAGWQYGFPKVYPGFDPATTDPSTLETWLKNNGYPQKLIDQGMAKHCWFTYFKMEENENEEEGEGSDL